MMNHDLVSILFGKFEIAKQVIDGVEYWSARDLQEDLVYTEWRNFTVVIDRAKKACENSNGVIADHFVGINKMIDLGKDAHREIEDYALTRYACYLIALNGVPSKNEIAFAQTYFAVQTRKQEIIEKRLQEIARLHAREKLTGSEKKLSGIIYERGVDEKGFARIRSSGDRALFGGFSTQDMKKRLSVPEGRPLADFLPTLSIKAKDFATELTSHNVVEKNIKGEHAITLEHVDNNSAVRKMLNERGVKPEKLPPEEDVKKLSRRLKSEHKEIINTGKKKITQN